MLRGFHAMGGDAGLVVKIANKRNSSGGEYFWTRRGVV